MTDINRAIEALLGNQVNILHALAVIIARLDGLANEEMARLLGEAAQLTVLEQQKFIENTRVSPASRVR